MSVIKYIINLKATIKEALMALDGNTHDWQTLFVVDDNEKMVGTLTDGDIRRALIAGVELSDAVRKAMHTNFKFLRNGQYNAKQLKEYRAKQIYFVPVLDEQNHIIKTFGVCEANNQCGTHCQNVSEKPTNGEFIALVADKMILEGA